MLTHPTFDQLRALKLDGMAQAFLELEAQEETRSLAHAEWLALLLDREAASRNTSALVEIILRERTHPEQGFRACVGILRLAKTYGRERLEAACSRAIEIGARSYSSVNSILKNDLDRRRPATPADGPAIAHDNIRGPTYFH